jgi:hypothetical protein
MTPKDPADNQSQERLSHLDWSWSLSVLRFCYRLAFYGRSAVQRWWGDG